ncbi:hypothetical protein Dimus_038650 [Dionaea muscipula]
MVIGLLNENRCVLWNGDREIKNHLFCECSYSQEVLRGTLQAAHKGWSRNTVMSWANLKERFVKLTRGKSEKVGRRRGLFAEVVYKLWRERNRRIFTSYD